MRIVQCHDCGKRYDYDADDFCPKCGAFNQPPRRTAIGADGAVVRVDGLNEANHQESFVHRELHAEDRERRARGLERKRPAPKTPPVRKAWERRERKQNAASVLVKVVAAVIFLNILFSLLSGLLYIIF